MEAAGGESLTKIILRKEAERQAGEGIFWWGIGSSLGTAVLDVAQDAGGELPLLFSKMLSKPKMQDEAPEHVCVWNGWRRADGKCGELPETVLITGGSDPAKPYYALSCQSAEKLALADHGSFDPKQCRTRLGKMPGSSQVTCLLRNTNPKAHSNGLYRVGFRATLVSPWSVRLTDGRLLTKDERNAVDRFAGAQDDWLSLVRTLRRI